MAQSGVLRMPRVQLIRGLARTIEKADLSADDRQTMPQVSSTVGRCFGGELIPAALTNDRFLELGSMRYVQHPSPPGPVIRQGGWYKTARMAALRQAR